MDYKYKKYSSSYLPTLTSLLDRSFSIENNNKEGLITWKYFDSYLNNQTITYIALDEKNIPVSHYANLPIEIMQQNNTYKAMICTDMCTDLAHRGKGLISELSSRVYKDVVEKGYDISVGFSNDAGVKVDKYAKNYGYQIVGKFVRYFKGVLTRKNIPLTLVKANDFPEERYASQSEFFKIKKDRHYLTWRYVRKPNSEYDIYHIMKGDILTGYVVLRFVDYKCYVYDLVTISDDKNSMVTILRSIENKALDLGVRLVIYNVLDNAYWKDLFNKYKYYKKENNVVNYYLTVKIHNKKIDTGKLLNKQNWLVMNGDIL